MLRIRDLILPETHDVSELYYHAAQVLHVRASDIAALHIFRRSLDARKKPDLRWVYTVDVTLRSGEGAVLRRCRLRALALALACALTALPPLPAGQTAAGRMTAPAGTSARRPAPTVMSSLTATFRAMSTAASLFIPLRMPTIIGSP